MTERIRVLYLIDTLSDPTRGSAAHLRRLISRLDREFFVPMVVTVRPIPTGLDASSFHCPVMSIGLQHDGLIGTHLALRKLRRLLRDNSFDVACAYNYWARLIGLPEARAAGIPVCLAVVHDMGQHLMPDTLVALQAANRAALRFVTNAGASASRLVRQERIQRDRIDIIPGGIDWRTFEARTPQAVADAKHRFGFSIAQPIIVIDASATGSENLVAFLRAAAHLRPHHPSARFVILGSASDPDIGHARGAAGQMDILDQLTIEHDPGIQQQWLTACDAAVSTSLVESCSEAVLSYMARGLPIVAVDAGGNAELIVHGQTGYLVPPVEPDALAMRIHLLLLADDLAAEFGTAARERVRTDFDANHEVRRFSDYYRTLAYSYAGSPRP